MKNSKYLLEHGAKPKLYSKLKLVLSCHFMLPYVLVPFLVAHKADMTPHKSVLDGFVEAMYIRDQKFSWSTPILNQHLTLSILFPHVVLIYISDFELWNCLRKTPSRTCLGCSEIKLRWLTGFPRSAVWFFG